MLLKCISTNMVLKLESSYLNVTHNYGKVLNKSSILKNKPSNEYHLDNLHFQHMTTLQRWLIN